MRASRDSATVFATLAMILAPACAHAAPATSVETQRVVLAQPTPRNFDRHDGFVQIFDGKTLSGWDGDPAVWRVEDGAIVAVRPAGQITNNSYLVYRGIKAHDFDLRLEIKAAVGGSGIQYRSRTGVRWLTPVAGRPEPDPKWMMTGPQADFWPAKTFGRDLFSGQVYMENEPERTVSWRGQVTRRAATLKPELLGKVGDGKALADLVHPDGWNEYEIIARGPVVLHLINGQLMSVHINDDPQSPDNRSGLIGIEAELNPARIEVRNVWLRKLN